MSVEFLPVKGPKYLETLRKHSKVPQQSSDTIVIYRRTKFVFYIDRR